jgi:hypothetical protein
MTESKAKFPPIDPREKQALDVVDCAKNRKMSYHAAHELGELAISAIEGIYNVLLEERQRSARLERELAGATAAQLQNDLKATVIHTGDLPRAAIPDV